MSEKNRCTVCGETLELNGLNKLIQDLTGGLAGLSGIFAGHWNEGNLSHDQIDTEIDDIGNHMENDGIHFEKTAISHNDLQDKGTNLHSEIDEHIDDDSIHFEKTEISHNDLQDKGTNPHSAIDSHLTDDVIKNATNVQEVLVGGNFSGTIGNMLHGSTQRCTISGLNRMVIRTPAPTNYDYLLTKDESWHSLDLSNIVPSGAVAVLICLMTNGGAEQDISYVSGTNGNMWDGIKVQQLYTGTNYYNGIVPIRTNQTVYYNINNGLSTVPMLTVIGWWV